MFTLLIECGSKKVEVKTAYKKTSQMADDTSPEPNVLNDSAKSSAFNVSQTEKEVKDAKGIIIGYKK